MIGKDKLGVWDTLFYVTMHTLSGLVWPVVAAHFMSSRQQAGTGRFVVLHDIHIQLVCFIYGHQVYMKKTVDKAHEKNQQEQYIIY